MKFWKLTGLRMGEGPNELAFELVVEDISAKEKKELIRQLNEYGKMILPVGREFFSEAEIKETASHWTGSGAV